MDVRSTMLSLADKYSADFPPRSRYRQNVPHGDEYILLTGSTGALGTYLLAALVQQPRVKRIYLFNRPSKTASLLERQKASLVERGLDPRIADDDKVVLLEGVTFLPKLGLSDAAYQELQATLTCIIHGAWALNFNKPLLTFEPYIAGSRSLLDLALTSAKDVQFLFTSSLASVVSWDGEVPVTETLYDPGYAIGIGYGESKWVVEQILVRVAEKRNLRSTTFRIGQLSGSTINGAWNATDWVPRIVQTGFRMGALPVLDERATVTWFPIDAAAISIVEALLHPTRGSRLLSVAHPTPSSWNAIIRYIGEFISKTGGSVAYIPFDLWLPELERLASQPSAPSTYSAVKLLGFLHGCMNRMKRGNSGSEAMGMPKLATREMSKVSRILGNMPMLTRVNVDGWMRYWERNGMFAKDHPEQTTQARM